MNYELRRRLQVRYDRHLAQITPAQRQLDREGREVLRVILIAMATILGALAAVWWLR